MARLGHRRTQDVTQLQQNHHIPVKNTIDGNLEEISYLYMTQPLRTSIGKSSPSSLISLAANHPVNVFTYTLIFMKLSVHNVDSALRSFDFEVGTTRLSRRLNQGNCFSLIAPTANDSPLNNKINELKNELNLMYTTARSGDKTLKD